MQITTYNPSLFALVHRDENPLYDINEMLYAAAAVRNITPILYGKYLTHVEFSKFLFFLNIMIKYPNAFTLIERLFF